MPCRATIDPPAPTRRPAAVPPAGEMPGGDTPDGETADGEMPDGDRPAASVVVVLPRPPVTTGRNRR